MYIGVHISPQHLLYSSWINLTTKYSWLKTIGMCLSCCVADPDTIFFSTDPDPDPDMNLDHLKNYKMKTKSAKYNGQTVPQKELYIWFSSTEYM